MTFYSTVTVAMTTMKDGTNNAVYKDNAAARSHHALLCVALFWNFVSIQQVLSDDESRVDFLRGCGLSDEDIEAL